MDFENNIGSNNTQTTRTIFDDCICVEISFKRFGIKKKVAKGKVKTDANEKYVRTTKDIIDSGAYDRIVKFDNETRDIVSRYAVPSILREGSWLVKIESFEALNRQLEDRASRRRELVDAFVDIEYRPQIEAMRAELGSLWDARNYPPAEKVRDLFDMIVRFTSYSTPQQLARLNPEVYAKAVSQARAEIASATDEIRDMMRAAMADLVDHLVDRLERKQDGSQKIFRDTLIDNVREFIDTFGARNIVDDEALAALVQRARGILDNQGLQIDAQSLRDSNVLSDRVRSGFAELKASLDEMLVDRPKRKINFDL